MISSIVALLGAPARAAPAASAGRFQSKTEVERRVGARVDDPARPPGDVRRYGAIGDGAADDSRALSDALSVCHEGGYTMYLPAGRYRITAPLAKRRSFKCPSIRGEGYAYSSISYAELDDRPAIYIQGGSGRMCGGTVEGIAFEGSGKSCAIEIDGQCGMSIRDCEFRANAVGLRLRNGSTGAFTERVVAENCAFTDSCATALQYLVAGGSDSFNGSGLRHCSMVHGAHSDASIYIGPGAVPYNAPLSFEVWTTGPRQTVIWNASKRTSLFQGNINVETMGKIENQSQAPILARGDAVYLIGGTMSLGYVDFGSLVAGTHAAVLGPESGASNGRKTFRRHPWSRRIDLTSGNNEVEDISQLGAGIVCVEVTAAGYDYRCMLAAVSEGKTYALSLATLAASARVDAAGFGAPTLSVDSRGSFIIRNDNFPRTGVTAYVDFLPVGLSRTAFGPSAVEYGNVH